MVEGGALEKRCPTSWDPGFESQSLRHFMKSPALRGYLFVGKNIEDKRVACEVLLKGLNKEQQAAVLYDGGPLLVLAGAGSGKTRVLTTRILSLINRGIAPSDILAVTFTNRAAKEMATRIRAHGGVPEYIGTFHSMGLRILRRHAVLVGRGLDFLIFDDQDQLVIIKEVFKSLGIDEKQESPKGIRERISRCKDGLDSPQDVKAKDAYGEDAAFVAVYQAYEAKLVALNGFDFGDLIAQTVHLFKKSPEVLNSYQQQFKHILVDEYQDTNAAQYQLITLLAAQHRQITVVGDPDQSIYEWRGADIENILRFEKDFKGTQVIRLEQNYRSTNTILKAANAVISHNQNRKPKELWSDNGDGERIHLFRALDERAEARHLVQQLLHLKRDGKYALKEMVGFYRTHAQSRVIEEELIRHRIVYKIVGGVKFYARKEIKDLLAYLRLIANDLDEVSFLRVINIPKRGLGKAAVEKLVLFARQQRCSIYQAIPAFVISGDVSARAKKSFKDFYAMVESLKQADLILLLPELLDRLMADTGYVEMLEKEHTMEAKARIENIREFYQSVTEFQTTYSNQGQENLLQAYLEYIVLQTDMDTWVEDDQVFTLMTLHSAKGLEFPVVFMLGLEEGLLPHGNSLNASEKELEEERRLCYVGFTRARERLFLSYADVRRIFGYQRRQMPSRFLYEVPTDLFTQSLHEDIYQNEISPTPSAYEISSDYFYDYS